MKPYFQISIFILSLFFFNPIHSNAQEELNSWMEYEGNKVLVTRAIDSKILGAYIQFEPNVKKILKLDANLEESYIQYQTTKDPFQEGYNGSINRKNNIEWGVLTQNGEIAQFRFNEFKDGAMRSYKAMVVIYKDPQTGKYVDLLLYNSGSYWHLGIATKKESLAIN